MRSESGLSGCCFLSREDSSLVARPPPPKVGRPIPLKNQNLATAHAMPQNDKKKLSSPIVGGHTA